MTGPRNLIFLLLPLIAAAQPAGKPPADPPADPTASKPLVFSVTLRSRTEIWNWFGDSPGTYAFQGSSARFAVSKSSTRLDWHVEFMAPILLALPTDAALPAPQGPAGLGANYYLANQLHRNAIHLFPKQVFLRYKSLAPGGPSLRVGRFEFNDGQEIASPNPTLAAVKASRIEQRLIGSFGWTHVGRSFDGLHFQTGRKTVVTAMAATPTRGVFQVNGWGNLPVAVVYASVSGTTNRPAFSSDWRLFGIYYDDQRGVLKTDNRPASVRAADPGSIGIGTFGGHYLAARPTSRGLVDFAGWAALQAGRWGSLTHQAASFNLEGGWQPQSTPRLKPWLRGGYAIGSGDGKAADNKHGTFFQILPTPRPFARTPFYNLSNSQDLFAILQLRPSPKAALRFEAHRLWLANRHDLWYQGGGAFETKTFGYAGRPSGAQRGLGTLADANLDLKVTPRVTATFYGGYLLGGDVQKQIYRGGGRGAFGYLEVHYRF